MKKKTKGDRKSLADMSKIELIEEALLKNVGGGLDTCGSDAGTECYHDTCYDGNCTSCINCSTTSCSDNECFGEEEEEQ